MLFSLDGDWHVHEVRVAGVPAEKIWGILGYTYEVLLLDE